MFQNKGCALYKNQGKKTRPFLVVGFGTMGWMPTKLSFLRAKVTVSETDSKYLAFAKEQRVDHVIDDSKQDLKQNLIELLIIEG